MPAALDDDHLSELLIDLLDRLPCPTVGQADRGCRDGNRAIALDGFEHHRAVWSEARWQRELQTQIDSCRHGSPRPCSRLERCVARAPRIATPWRSTSNKNIDVLFNEPYCSLYLR